MLHYPAPIAHTPRDGTLHAHTARYDRSSSSSTDSTTSSSCGSSPPRPISSSQSMEDILRTILNVRRSWKTLKGNTEPVWPPYLEVTMLKGLHEYKPIDSRETQILGRFPMRNRFISEYIYQKTGKYRSSKQIGSRLQQIRDTSEGRELIDSLTREIGSLRRFSPHNVFEGEFMPPLDYISVDSSGSDASSASSSTGSISSAEYTAMPSSKRHNPSDNRTPVYIDILPEANSFSSSSSSRSRVPPSSSYKPPQGVATSQPSSNSPRRMRDIDPTVTFVSPSTVIGKSSYIVLLDGAPIHSEDTKLECVGPYFTGSSGDGPLLYSTALVPKYWETLCKSPDPTVYTIIQDVFRAPDPAAPTGSSGRPRPVLIFSAIYHFRYSASACAPPPSISPHLVYQANSASLTNNTHAYPDFNSTRTLPFQNYAMPPGFSDPGMYQLHEYGTQNRLVEPFMLDVSMDNFSLDDFVNNIHDSPEATSSDLRARSSSSSFPQDIRNYIM